MQFGVPPPEPTKAQKIKAVVQETLWVVGTSAFVLLFPIYAAVKL